MGVPVVLRVEEEKKTSGTRAEQTMSFCVVDGPLSSVKGESQGGEGISSAGPPHEGVGPSIVVHQPLHGPVMRLGHPRGHGRLAGAENAHLRTTQVQKPVSGMRCP